MSTLGLTEQLATLPYFQTLAEERLVVLAGQMIARRFTAHDVLLLQGEPPAGLWMVKDGRVKVFRVSTDGREHILHLLGPGDSFNDIPALDRRPNAASAIALSDGAAWLLPTEALQAELRVNSDLAMAVIGILTDRTRRLVQQLEDMALCSVTTRLARFLLKRTENPAFSGPGVTRSVIASYLATTPETISRALRTLEDLGAIRFDRQQVVIECDDLLRTVAME